MLSIHQVFAFLSVVSCAAGAAIWETLPPTPTLPGNPTGSKTRINGVDIWHSEFRNRSDTGIPVLMLHGGFGNSDYYGRTPISTTQFLVLIILN
jgi:pimeloyl-ACP methyl ester carboxylesterase